MQQLISIMCDAISQKCFRLMIHYFFLCAGGKPPQTLPDTADKLRLHECQTQRQIPLRLFHPNRPTRLLPGQSYG